MAFAATLTATYSLAEAAPASPERMQRGAYLARAGDCTGCHTAGEEALPFTGGMPFVIPGAEVHSTNITPDPETDASGGLARVLDFASGVYPQYRAHLHYRQEGGRLRNVLSSVEFL